MFPETLDGAKVLFYTSKGNYGVMRYTTGEVFDNILYYAICKYENDTRFYLFGCNADFEVITDCLWDSVEECQHIAQRSCNLEISWIRKY